MSHYPVIVRDGRNKVSNYSFKLALNGFIEAEEGRYVKTCRSKKEVEKVKVFCDKHHLKFAYDNEYAERDKNYRYRYFSSHPPDIFGQYFCCYCGRLMTRGQTTVDHLYPVGAVSQDLRLQKKLRRLGIDNINDEKNLVAACLNCNSAKGKKLGKWILRGRIGRHKWIWIIRWIIRFLILAVALYILYYLARYQRLPEAEIMNAITSGVEIVDVMAKGIQRWLASSHN